MADLANIVEELSKLTVIEAADLVKQLETKWGVSAAAPVAVAAAGGGGAAAAAPAEAKDAFDVILVSVPADKKIAAIKAVREIKAGLGLAEAKALADLPSIDVLRAKILGLLVAPATKLVTLINTPAVQLAQVIKAKSEKA